jgi:D-sedoheptulose 7-phosphate isomerase
MNPPPLLHANIDAAIAQFQLLRSLAAPLQQAAQLLADCLTTGHKLLTCGNGGSAADASHIATEFLCRFQNDRRGYPAISLVDFGSTLTAIGNDYRFDDIFARQIQALGQHGDVLLALSTSGRSPNIVRALQTAREMNLTSIAFLGRDGGQAAGLATVDLIVPGDRTVRIQEAHLLLYHTLCELVEQQLPRE